MKIASYLMLAFVSLFSVESYASKTYTLKEYFIKGDVKVCVYSNDVVITIHKNLQCKYVLTKK